MQYLNLNYTATEGFPTVIPTLSTSTNMPISTYIRKTQHNFIKRILIIIWQNSEKSLVPQYYYPYSRRRTWHDIGLDDKTPWSLAERFALGILSVLPFMPSTGEKTYQDVPQCKSHASDKPHKRPLALHTSIPLGNKVAHDGLKHIKKIFTQTHNNDLTNVLTVGKESPYTTLRLVMLRKALAKDFSLLQPFPFNIYTSTSFHKSLLCTKRGQHN